MSFWEALWLVVVTFAFVAYLMVMFSILTDLFRDTESRGVVKAVWVVALIVLPVLTALVYLIAKGEGMARRSLRAAARVQAEQEEYIRSVAAVGSSPADQIMAAKQLLDMRLIDEAEFAELKRKALGGTGHVTSATAG